MDYRVSITGLAAEDIATAVERLNAEYPRHAARWLNTLEQAIASLTELPARCALAPESEDVGYPIRQLIVGRATARYRVLFDIIDQEIADPAVRILRIWHGARDRLRLEDLDPETDFRAEH